MTDKLDLLCLRCGKCCLADVTAYITDQDVNRWRCEDRQDILLVLDHNRMIWAGDHMISAKNGHYARGCPFLVVDDDHWLCSIYDTRPRTCRAYRPGSSEICPQWVPTK